MLTARAKTQRCCDLGVCMCVRVCMCALCVRDYICRVRGMFTYEGVCVREKERLYMCVHVCVCVRVCLFPAILLFRYDGVKPPL